MYEDIHVYAQFRTFFLLLFFGSSLQEVTGRPVASNKPVTCAELVLDVSPKTQRVILKKKVRELRPWGSIGIRDSGLASSCPASDFPPSGHGVLTLPFLFSLFLRIPVLGIPSNFLSPFFVLFYLVSFWGHT